MQPPAQSVNGHLPAGIPETDETPAILQDLGPLTGLPGDARYRPVVGKSPSFTGWNSDPSLWLTAEQVLKERAVGGRWTGIGLLTGSKVGRLCWLDFDGEETDPETGELVKSAECDFESLFLMSVADLPPCPISISGRPGRFRALFRVPAEWADYFSGFSITSSETPTKAFEFLYEKAGGKLFHAVVEGEHPDGQGWFYRWRDGCSPAEVEVPELPARVIAGLVRHIARKSITRAEAEDQGDRAERKGGESGPMDLLSPGRQMKCLSLMQEFWPFRGGEAGTGFAGHHGVMRRLVLSLWRGIDDHRLFEQWMEGCDWDLKNDWAGEHGSAAVNGGGLVTWAKSLARSDTPADMEVKPWAAAWSLAVENGWKPPKWALPPRELDAASLAAEAAKEVNALLDGIAEIDKMESPAQRLCAMQKLSRSLGKTGAEMSQLLQSVEEGEESVKPMTLTELLATDSSISPAIHGLLARGCLSIVASQGGVAKTSLCYQMAAAIATGGLFAGKMQAVEGPVMIIQKDETSLNAKQKVSLMDLGRLDAAHKDRIQFRFGWHPGMFPELRAWIKEFKPVALFMDSFGTLFGGGGTSINEAEGALHLYRLNKLASEENVAILVTHHLRKPGKEGEKKKGDEPKRVSASQLYGSSYIVNAASDVWGLMRDGGEDDAPVFALNVIKPRSGITQQGDRFELQGNLDDLSFAFQSFNLSTTAEELTGSSKDKVLKCLSGRSPETGVSVAEVVSTTGVTPKTAARLLRQLYADRANTKVERTTGKAATKPVYLYYRAT
jgi:hypothetical protein